jgi:hypothetical protein
MVASRAQAVVVASRAQAVVVALSLLAALTIAACGGSGHTTTSTRSGTPPPGATVPAQRAVPAGTITRLQGMLPTSADEPGFTLSPSQAATTVSAWVADTGAAASQTAVLRRDGFVAAVFAQGGNATTGAQQTASVAEFGGAASARTESNGELAAARSAALGPTHELTVAGVPGAQGLRTTGTNGPVADVFWIQGRCALSLGYQGAGLSTALLAHTVHSAYERTRNDCP